LIGRLPQLSLQDPDDEEKLVRLLQSYQARTGKQITVVFDPGGAASLAQTRQVGRIQVVFAPYGRTADAVIARRVRQARNPRGLRVITSDTELAQIVAQEGAGVQSADDFAAELARLREHSPEREDVHLSPQEVESWLLLFEGQDRNAVG